MNSGNRSKRVSLNRRGGIAGFFWGNLSKSRRLTGIAFAMLLLASAVAAVLYINFGDSLAAVKAEVTSGSDYDSADGENTDAEDDFDPDADPAFGLPGIAPGAGGMPPYSRGRIAAASSARRRRQSSGVRTGVPSAKVRRAGESMAEVRG